MNARWILILLIWLSTAVGAVLTIGFIPREQALEWFGALLAGSVAFVTLIHLIKARPAGIAGYNLVMTNLPFDMLFTGLLVLAGLAIAGVSALVLVKLFKGQK